MVLLAASYIHISSSSSSSSSSFFARDFLLRFVGFFAGAAFLAVAAAAFFAVAAAAAFLAVATAAFLTVADAFLARSFLLLCAAAASSAFLASTAFASAASAAASSSAVNDAGICVTVDVFLLFVLDGAAAAAAGVDGDGMITAVIAFGAGDVGLTDIILPKCELFQV